MSPIILYMTWHPVAFCVAIIAGFAPFVWALTSIHGVLS